MKKIFNIFLALALVSPLASCDDDYLEVKSPDKLTTDNFWRNKADAEAGLAAAYSQLEGFIGWDEWQEGRPVIEYYRNDLVQPGADAYNYSWWTDHFNFTYTPGNYAIYLLWQTNYRGLNFTNQVIEKVSEMEAETISEDDRNQVVAEAKFLRAYYHLKLLINFEQIIIREKAPAGSTDLTKGLSTREEAWDFILNDLNAASKVLPAHRTESELGRASKGAALAYLGKAYLYRAGEEKANAATYLGEAKKALKAVIDLKEYDLEDSFLSLFNGTNENSSESVFELQLSPNKENGANYDMWFQYFVGASNFGFWEEILGTEALLNEMKSEGKTATTGNYDTRVYETMFFNDEFFNNNSDPQVYGDTFDNWFGAGSTKISFRKYLPASSDQFYDRSAINFPLLRYSDVLLMYAEVLNETVGTAEAIPYINQVRARADMPAMTGNSKEEVMKQIQHERIMEFTLDGSRFFDLRRWGIIGEKMQAAGRTGFDASKHLYYPIPEDEVKANPAIGG